MENNKIDSDEKVKKIYETKKTMKECDVLSPEVVKKTSKMATKILKEANEKEL